MLATLPALLRKLALRVLATYGDLRANNHRRRNEGGGRNSRGRDEVHTRYLLAETHCASAVC